MTAFGDVYGRFDGKTKGECIRGAREMAENFRRAGGSFIAMDYGNWPDLGVSPEMQQLARDVLIANSKL